MVMDKFLPTLLEKKLVINLLHINSPSSSWGPKTGLLRYISIKMHEKWWQNLQLVEKSPTRTLKKEGFLLASPFSFSFFLFPVWTLSSPSSGRRRAFYKNLLFGLVPHFGNIPPFNILLFFLFLNFLSQVYFTFCSFFFCFFRCLDWY